MIDISVNSLGKLFGDTRVLQGVSFDIQSGQKVGLIGKNGSGKTTLFRILVGDLRYEEGSVSIHRSKKLGILDQIPKYPAGTNVRGVLETAFAPIREIEKEMARYERIMSLGGGVSDILATYGELQQRYEAMGGYDTETSLMKVANGLGIDREMLMREFAELSGGEQTLVNLGRMLLENIDIMLLDEPTNHLDMSAVEWLEGYLSTYKGTAVIISHDRYFLDRVVTRVIELENTHACVYEGNYSDYAVAKERMLAQQQARYEQLQKKIDALSYTAQRMHGWGMGNDALQKRAFALDKRIERLRREQPDRVRGEKTLGGKFKSAERSGNDVLFIDRLSKAYGSKTLFSEIDLDIKKDESVGLIGDNGSGKTTLLGILLGDVHQDGGFVRWGSNIKLAYLPQKVRFDDENATVLDTVTTALGITDGAARNRLGMYHFEGDDVFKTVSVLSGGEKSRLKLCILMYSEINTLILDEPTNHLDISSREWIETMLEDFDGTLIFVSHDRYFINRFATRIWSLENGGVTDFRGTYEQYREYCQRQEVFTRNAKKDAVSERKEIREPLSGDKLLRKKKRESAQLEKDIALSEEKIAKINVEMEAAATDHIKLAELLDKLENENTELSEMYEKWEEIELEISELEG